MENIFIDTNIVIDLLEKRKRFYKEAQELFSLADQKKTTLYISALTIANTHFMLHKYLKMDARKVLSQFKVLVEVLPLDDNILELAMASNFKDFEDAIQYYTAIKNNMQIIITRNKKDFKNSSIPILTAKEYLKR